MTKCLVCKHDIDVEGCDICSQKCFKIYFEVKEKHTEFKILVDNLEQCLKDNHDPENLHSEEDEIYLQFIEYIASTNSVYTQIAKEVLRIVDLDFPRWYS